jgi:hypothetical protein
MPSLRLWNLPYSIEKCASTGFPALPLIGRMSCGRGKCDHQIHLGSQANVASGYGPWRRREAKRAIGIPRNIHEQVERAWNFRGLKPKLAHSGKEIVGAIVVVALYSEKGIAVAVTGRDQGIVNSAGCVFGQCQDRPALVGAQDIAGPGNKVQVVGARMLIRHELAKVSTVERPGIDHLFAMSIDDGNHLPGRNKGGLATPCWNFDEGVGHASRLRV